MATYTTNEVTFDLPDGFVDRSLTFLLNGSTTMPITVVVSRDPREGTLEEQVAGIVEDLIKDGKDGVTKLRGLREREVANLEAREGKFSTILGRNNIYVRQAWVSYYD